MAFNLLTFLENLFHIGTPSTPVQAAINTAGKALDDAEAILNTLQGLTSSLPAPFQGYLAAFAVTVHSLDAYVDTLETAPAAAPAPAAPTPASASNP